MKKRTIDQVVNMRAILTYDQAAMYMACSDKHIAFLVETGQIGYIEVPWGTGETKRIPKKELDNYIDNKIQFTRVGKKYPR